MILVEKALLKSIGEKEVRRVVNAYVIERKVARDDIVIDTDTEGNFAVSGENSSNLLVLPNSRYVRYEVK